MMDNYLVQMLLVHLMAEATDILWVQMMSEAMLVGKTDTHFLQMWPERNVGKQNQQKTIDLKEYNLTKYIKIAKIKKFMI